MWRVCHHTLSNPIMTICPYQNLQTYKKKKLMMIIDVFMCKLLHILISTLEKCTYIITLIEFCQSKQTGMVP
jgi:hypothetical protein